MVSRRAIGFACAKAELIWVVLDGSPDAFSVVAHQRALAPKNRTRPEELSWLRGEVLVAALDTAITHSSYKDVEHMARGASTAPRFESQGVLQEAWHTARPDVPIHSLVAARIKSVLKFKGQISALPAFAIVGTPLQVLPQTYKDASLAALCALSGYA